MNVKPIRTESDYEQALEEIDRLMDAKLGTRKGDRLDVLVTLLEAYEEKHWRIDPPDPIEAIKLRMDQKGLTRRDLEKVLGSRSRVSEILNGKRTPDLFRTAEPLVLIRLLGVRVGRDRLTGASLIDDNYFCVSPFPFFGA